MVIEKLIGMNRGSRNRELRFVLCPAVSLPTFATGLVCTGGMPFAMTRAIGPLPERRGSDPVAGAQSKRSRPGYLDPRKNEVRRRLLFRILLLPLRYKIKEIRVMANLRDLKKEIDYRLEEIVFDCDMAICFQPSKQEEIFKVMEEAVGVRNALYIKVNNPAEPHNRSLVRKHYAALRSEMVAAYGELFEKLSAINK